MPEAACLHIQARETDPVRVVEIPGASVRIGRASYCEVRLTEPELAEEECQLHRKGEVWQLVPVRGATPIWFNGRPVQEPCNLAFDIPFRIGDYWLTLRPAPRAVREWGSFHAPIPLKITDASSIVTEVIRPDRPLLALEAGTPARTPEPEPRPSEGTQADHLSRWRERQEQRTSRLKTNREERRWEERWRAAGEKIRAHAPSETPTIATPNIAPGVDESRTRPADSLRVPRETAKATNRVHTETRPLDPGVSYRPSVAPIPRVPRPGVPKAATAPGPPLGTEIPVARPEWLTPSIPRQAPPLPTRAVEEPRIPVSAVSASIPAAPTDLIPSPSALVDAPIAETPAKFLDAETLSTIETWDQILLPPVPAETSPLTEAFPSPDDDEPFWHDENDLEDAEVEELENVEEARVQEATPAPPEFPEIAGTDADDVDVLLVDSEPVETEEQGTDREFADAEVMVEEPPPVSSILEAPPEPVVAFHDQVEDSVAPTTDVLPEHSFSGIESDPSVFAEEVETVSRLWIEQGPFVADTLGDHESVPAFLPEPVDLSTTVHDIHNDSHEVLEAAPAAEPAFAEPAFAELPLPTAAPRVAESVPQDLWSPAVVAPEAEATEVPPTEDHVHQPSPRDWPSAREIFTAHAATTRAQSGSPRSVRIPGLAANPTVSREPACWNVPLWLGWPIAAALTLTVGGVGLALSALWASDTRSVGAVASRLASPKAFKDPLPSFATAPDGSWWRTSATNLMTWAHYLDRRSVDDPSLNGQVQALLDTTGKASTLDPQLRYAKSRRGTTDETASPLNETLGLSHDVVALAWSGRRWLEAGKKATAVVVYREALDLASRMEPVRLASPAFDEDPRMRRYRLPGDDMFTAIVTDMAGQSSWTYDEWSQALPPYSEAHLAAARVLTERGNAESAKAVDTALAVAEGPAPDGTSLAIHLAGRAEALALKGRWADAEESYRRAIELMPIGAVQRTWWLNIAEIDTHLNDDAKRQKALEAAKGINVNDEVAKRAMDLLKYGGSIPERSRAGR